MQNRSHRLAGLAACASIALLAPHAADAQSTPTPGSDQLNGAKPAATASQGPTPGNASVPTVPFEPSPGEPGFVKGLDTRKTLLGDMFSIRPNLGRYGVSLGITETEEVLGNTSGGVRQGAIYEGLTQLGLGVDTAKAFGWPVLTVADLYAGGPAFPLSSLGVRGRVQVSDNVTVLAGVFDDNPPGGSFYDNLQVRGASQSGTSFNLNTGALFIAEVQYATNPARAGNAPAAAQAGLPGVYKLGGWFDSGQLAVQSQNRVQDLDQSGVPMRPTDLLRHDWSVYATADQAIWAPVPGGPQTVAVFGRAMGAPGDRNLVSVSVNGGVVLKAPFASRPQDSVGIGTGYNRISDRARLVDTQQQAGGYFGNSIRSSEAFVEATYQARLTPCATAQPDVQYVIDPGGHLNKPDGSGQRVKNALILGSRTTITF